MTVQHPIDRLWGRLTREERDALDATVRAADEADMPLFLVGGGLRDLLLERPILDIDLVVEGDAAALARRVADTLDGRCTVYPAFGTTTVKGHGYAFDIAMARSETYARPGALPRVRPANIDADLTRRDFTINAMALALTGPTRGRIIDPSGGQADLRQGLVRVLHDNSFSDDATRTVRALRYETRLGFDIEAHTLGLLRRDVAYLQTIGGARLRRELLRLLDEGSPQSALLRARDLGMLKAIHPSLRFDAAQADAFAMARREAMEERLPPVYLALLAYPWSPRETGDIALRLTLTRAQRLIVEAMPRLRALEPRLAAEARPSRLTELLSSFPAPTVLALALLAADPAARAKAKRYLEEWRHVKTSLDGTALLRLGIAKGPAMGEMLGRLRVARLDGEISTRQEEMALVRGTAAGKSSARRDGRKAR